MKNQITNEDITNVFNQLAAMVHLTARSKGWWEEKRNKGEMIALMHSELSEALEAIRKPGPSEHIPEFSGIEEELADTVIRILDYAYAFGLDLPGAIMAKMKFNANRPYKHGGKKF
jgi:NTP pyrophosphatase (non-canonical NTP hydrolase)